LGIIFKAELYSRKKNYFYYTI